MELTQKQIDVIEILTQTEGLDYEIARKIAIETNGDLIRARTVASNYKYHENTRKKLDQM